MSLIADALRKAGHPPTIPLSVSPPSKKPRWTSGVVLLGSVALVALFLGYLSAGPTRKVASTETESNTASLATEPNPLATEPKDMNVLHSAESQWRLNGIVRGGQGEPLAVINGQVLEEGSPVQGARIIRIAKDQVDLETEGQVKTLTLVHPAPSSQRVGSRDRRPVQGATTQAYSLEYVEEEQRRNGR